MTGCNFGRRWIGQLEPVSHPRLSHDVAGVSGVLFDFLPELVYYNAQVFGFFGVVRAPNGLQKPFMCKRLSLLHNQDAQNLKLLGAKVYPLAPNVDDPFFQIDTQFRSFHLRQWFVDRDTSKRCPDSSKELAYGKRLYNVIVRARIKRANLVLFGVAHRHHDDWPFEGQSNLAAGFEAAHAGHINVQKDQGWMLLKYGGDSVFPVFGFNNIVPITGKSGSKHPTNLRLVVDDQNGCVFHLHTTLVSGTAANRRRNEVRNA